MVKFNYIDLIGIKSLNDYDEVKGYLAEIKTQVANNYREIKEKYLIKLGSFGLSNRLNILKNIENGID